jgi:hypothetical protein
MNKFIDKEQEELSKNNEIDWRNNWKEFQQNYHK